MKKGFTLIELLVIIAIICILSIVVTGSVKAAREKNKALEETKPAAITVW